MTLKLELTDDELRMIIYSIREMGHKRSGQALEHSSKARQILLRREAQDHYELASKINEASKQ